MGEEKLIASNGSLLTSGASPALESSPSDDAGIDWAEILKTATPIVTVAIALLYGIGVLVTNSYLVSIGVNDFNLFRPRCILTGAWSAGVLFFFSLPAITLLSTVSARPGRYTRKRITDLMIAGTVIGAGANWLLLSTLGVEPHLKNAGFYLAGELLILLPAALNLLVNYLHKKRGPPKPGYPRKPGKIGVTMLTISAVVFMLVFIGRLAYPEVSPVFGGGKPQSARLVLNRDGVLVWKQLQLVTGQEVPDALLTSEIQILYDTETHLVIQAKSEKGEARILSLDKKLIFSVVPNPVPFL